MIIIFLWNTCTKYWKVSWDEISKHTFVTKRWRQKVSAVCEILWKWIALVNFKIIHMQLYLRVSYLLFKWSGAFSLWLFILYKSISIGCLKDNGIKTHSIKIRMQRDALCVTVYVVCLIMIKLTAKKTLVECW